jgi:hypothetical protein
VRTAAAAPCSAALLQPLLRVLLLTLLLPLHEHINNACTPAAMGSWQAAANAHDLICSASKLPALTSVLPPRLAR